MKIKLSKNQWEFIGKKANWVNKKAIRNPAEFSPEQTEILDLLDSMYPIMLQINEKIRNNPELTQFAKEKMDFLKRHFSF